MTGENTFPQIVACCVLRHCHSSAVLFDPVIHSGIIGEEY